MVYLKTLFNKNVYLVLGVRFRILVLDGKKVDFFGNDWILLLVQVMSELKERE